MKSELINKAPPPTAKKYDLEDRLLEFAVAVIEVSEAERNRAQIQQGPNLQAHDL